MEFFGIIRHTWLNFIADTEPHFRMFWSEVGQKLLESNDPYFYLNTLKKKDSLGKSSVLLIGMGSMFAGMILAGFVLGYIFDSLFDTKPIFIIGCGILGFIGGLQRLHKILAISQRSDSD